MKKEPKFEAEVTWDSPYWRVMVYSLPRRVPVSKYGGTLSVNERLVDRNLYCWTKLGAILSAKRMIHKAHKEARGKEGLTIRG